MSHRLRFILLVLAFCSGNALCADAGYKQLKLQDLLGAAWPEFAAELDSLMTNPKNEDGFYRMYKIAQRCDAESKVPQYLVMIAKDKPDNANIKTLLGMFYQENRINEQALKYYGEALSRQPDDYFVHYRIAQLQGKQDSDAALKDALAHYEKAAANIGSSDVDLKTKLLEEWGELIVSRSGDAPEQRNKAAEIWDRMVKDERHFDRITYERVAQIYERHEMWSKAIETLRNCLDNAVKEDNAGRVRILDRMGDLAERSKSFKDACNYYNEALGLVDENHWLHKQLIVKLARCNKQMNNGEAFVAGLEKTSADRPQSTAPLRDMALAQDSLDNPKATIEALERARKIAPRDVTIISDLLLLYSKQSGKETAPQRAELYSKLIELMPENFDAYVGLADVCFETGDTAKTQEALHRLRETASTLPEKYLVMARAFKKYGMKGNARSAFEMALSQDQSNIDAAMELCDFCLDCAASAQGDAASEPLQRAGELRDGLMAGNVLDESGYLRLTQVFQNHQKLDDAARIIGYAATTVFPKSFICRYALAELHYSRKEFYKAIQHYVAALDFAPSFYFKRLLNDRIVTLTYNYGRRDKDFMSEPTEEEKKKGLLGGSKGEGLAPWILYLRALTSRDPSNADNLMLLAQINEGSKVDAKIGDVQIKTDAASARALYKNVVDMDLKNLDAHAALARTLVATDEFEGAIKENWMLESLSPVGKWQYTMNVGDLWAFAGYGDKALKEWNAVREQATSEPNLVYQLGSRMYQLGKVDEAAELVKKAVDANRSEFRFHSTLGNLLDQLAEKDPARYDEATAEFRGAVDIASQNPMLLPYLMPVQRRLLDVQTQLAHSRFNDQKYAEAARTCADALAMIDKMKPAPATSEIADLKILRARALIASDNKSEGEALLRETAGANPNGVFWFDDFLKVGSQHMLALLTGGQLLPTAVTSGKPAPAFSLAPGKTVSMPTTIDSAQKVSDNSVFLKSGNLVFKVGAESNAIEPVKLPATGTVNWLGGDLAVQAQEGEFSLIDLIKQAPLWKKDLSLNGIAAGDSLVACFYTRKPVADAGKQPAATDKTFLKLLDKATGRELWEVEAGPGEVGFGDKVVVVRTGGQLQALSTTDGSRAWTAPLDPNAMYRRPLIDGQTLLLVNDLNNDVSAYDLNTGALKFVRAMGASLLCDPVIAGKDRVIFHVLRKRVAMLECLDLATGKLAWESGLRVPEKKVEAPKVTEQPAGKILREAWTGIEGGSVANLTANPKFTGKPDIADLLEKFAAPSDWGDNYGQRIRGFFIPPANGDYTFYIASDDSSELWVSAEGPAEKKQLICGMEGYAAQNQFDKYPNQKSQPIKLAAGKRYYIEALHKEGGGGDHVEVGCTLPDGKQENPIAGAHLAPIASADIVAPAPPLDSLQGVSLPPVAWNGWLLHLDPSKHRIWAARMDNGDVALPIDLAGVCESKLFDDITGWGVSGDSLYLVARTGRIALIKISK